MDALDWGTVYHENQEEFDEVLRRVGRVEYLLRKFIVHGDRDQALQAEMGQKVRELGTASNALAALLVVELEGD